MKRLISLLLICAMGLSLCACSSIYEKEYTLIEDYVPVQQQDTSLGDRVTVRTYAALKQAIQNMVLQGRETLSVVFDQDYEGDSAQDLSNACWQVRTENALCVYCVENISYEMSTVMTNEEAQLNVVYGDTGCSVEEIVTMPYATSIDLALQEALQAGKSQLVLMISYSTYTAASMEAALSRFYRLSPMLSPKEPQFSVSVFSGSGMQKLYDISIDYGMSEALRQLRLEELEKLRPFADIDMRRMNEREKLYELCRYLAANCAFGDEGSSVYDALVLGAADSQGLALAVVALCNELGIESQTIFGQRSWQDHWWNIVEIEGSRYHLDLSQYMVSGAEAPELCSDQQFWGSYRWDTSAYLPCPGDVPVEEEAED